MEMEDKRTDIRIPVDFFLNKIVHGIPYTCRASNISRGGLLVHPTVEPWVGDSSVGLQFQIPGEADLILCGGEVMHEYLAQHRASGIRFMNLEPRQRARINAFIERRLRQAA